MRNSGRYPLAGRGDINTYAVFAETDRELLGGKGRLGVILPTGIATDATTQYFFKNLVENAAIASLYDFENRKPLFEAVDSRFKFCLLTLTGRNLREPAANFAFFVHDPTELDRPGVRFALSPEEITLLNPNTGTCPIFRSRRDAEITLGIYRRVPVLNREKDPDGNLWGVKFMTMFHMSNDSNLFQTRDELEANGWVLRGNVFYKGAQEMLPLYQGMMADFYNHRAADVVRSLSAEKRQNQPRYLTDDDRADPNRVALPQYWVNSAEVNLQADWIAGFSEVTSPTNERTLVIYALPRVALGHKVIILSSPQPSRYRAAMLAMLASFASDFLVRQKLGGTSLGQYVLKQLPALEPTTFDQSNPWGASDSLVDWIASRVARLCYTAHDMVDFASSLGISRGPYVWDMEERRSIKAELDAAFFHLYGIGRDDVDYIMETFPIVKRKDMAEYGEYLTKRMILEIYDAMAAAELGGDLYESPFDAEGQSPPVKGAGGHNV